MKKLLKSEIRGSVNSTRDLHVTENWLKSQIFRLKKKKKRGQKRKRVWEAQNALPKRTPNMMPLNLFGSLDFRAHL